MKKISDKTILILGVFLFLLSYVFDYQVNLFFRNLRFGLFDFVFSIITNFGIVVLIMVVIPSIILYRKNKKPLYLLWLAFLASLIISFSVKLIFLRQRPIEAFTYPFTNIISYSFPSLHAMAVFSLLPILTRHLPKQTNFWIIFAFVVAFTRIYFGFHFLSDVVFGSLFGYFLGNYMLELYKKKRLWFK